MDTIGNTAGQGGDTLKLVRGRRSWTKLEEDALIICLTEVVHDGWKSENGFRAGFQRELEKGMKKRLPGTDIVAHPHINSKIHVWKKEYGAVSDLLSKSGIGWNSTTGMIEVEDEGVWESCKQADPHVKGIRYKTWPYYPQWIEIFGKDRATGENAVDPIDLINDLYRNGREQNGDNMDVNVPHTPDLNQGFDENAILSPTEAKLNASAKGKKRKSCDSDIAILVESLGEFMKHAKHAITDSTVGVEKGSSSGNENTQLNDIMKRIVGLKLSDKLKVCDELVQNVQRLNFFLSLPFEEQEEYVWMLLDGRL